MTISYLPSACRSFLDSFRSYPKLFKAIPGLCCLTGSAEAVPLKQGPPVPSRASQAALC